jgi:hypothetical protein
MVMGVIAMDLEHLTMAIKNISTPLVEIIEL